MSGAMIVASKIEIMCKNVIKTQKGGK